MHTNINKVRYSARKLIMKACSGREMLRTYLEHNMISSVFPRLVSTHVVTLIVKLIT